MRPSSTCAAVARQSAPPRALRTSAYHTMDASRALGCRACGCKGLAAVWAVAGLFGLRRLVVPPHVSESSLKEIEHIMPFACSLS